MLAIQAGSPEPELIHGSTEDYTEFRQFLTNNDLGVDANYQYAAQKYDVENLIDYKIAQIFVMNYDWPGNNNKLFKSKSGDGKWRHIMYDSDFGFERWTDLALGFIGSYETYNMLDHAIGEGNVFNNPVWSTAVLTTFLDNMDFRNKFIKVSYFVVVSIEQLEETGLCASSSFYATGTQVCASMMEFLKVEKEVKDPEADSLSYGSWLSWL